MTAALALPQKVSDEEIARRAHRAMTDPWYFLQNCVYTLDQVDKKNPIKRFPSHLPHTRLYCEAWIRELQLVVPKSRRMQMSWENIALFLWDTMFGVGRCNIFQSKKEESSDNLVGRAEFILKHIPEDQIPKEMIPKWNRTYCKLEFPEIHSQILGIPQGASQLREHTASGLLFDEFAFWDADEETYSAAIVTIEGGGRCTILSSARAGAYMEKVVFDRLDEDQVDLDGDKQKVIHEPPVHKFPMDGVECWKNPGNKFFVIQLHYTANPDKRSTEWKSHTKGNLSHKRWMQEYEISWESVAGKPVYPNFSKKLHTRLGIEPEPGLPLLRGWDFGLTPACVVGQLQGRQLLIFYEFIGLNMGIKRFANEVVLPGCRNAFPAWANPFSDWLDFIDPAGLQAAQTDETTCAQHMFAAGIKRIFPGAIDWETRRSSVDEFLEGAVKKGHQFESRFLIDPQYCDTCVRGFTGGYQYAEKTLIIEPDGKIKPIKNRFSHPHDGIQYLASGAVCLVRPGSRQLKEIPPPAYDHSQVRR